ncbi:MAG: DUF547 domain-containing protein [Kiritimatiellales bacterium]|jgi:peroxiredoxin
MNKQIWMTVLAGLFLGNAYSENPAAVGSPVPPLVLHTASGDSFDLSAAVKKQPAVLIFYRGGWCPYCNMHLAQLQTIEPQLIKLGYQILAISPDRPAKLAESIGKNHLSYTLLSDSSMEAAKAFGLAFEVDAATLEKYKGYGINLEEASGNPHHLLPVPAVFIVGTDGIIRFSHADPDYKVRLAPEEILRTAREALSSISLYDGALRTFVQNGQVDYKGLAANPRPLAQYLASAGQIPETEFKSWDEKQQLAFLINLYNASTLQLILGHYPVHSIKEIGNVFKGPWDQPVVPLFGKTITLNELEHGIIRKQYHDPRVHMALVCAAKGCPPLRSEAYTPEKLDAQLDDQARRYLASPAGLVIDRSRNDAAISSIFKWYGGDFPSLPAFIEKYSGQNLSGLNIRHLDYDWSLNER